METFTINIWEQNEYNYDTKTDFIPTLTGYVHGTKNKKPSVLIVPGGGYSHVSPTEAFVVALKFIEKGYNAFVLTYTTRTSKKMEPLKNQALKDLAKAIVIIKQNTEKWNVDTDKICTIGFSAGGHLVSSLSVHHNKKSLDEIKNGIDIKPKAQILSYPVISMSESFTHQGSKFSLLGENLSNDELDYWSTEKQVGEHTPPTFLWHCVDDQSVDIDNSLSFSKALKKYNIPFELHLFSYGSHGVSTSDDLWVKAGYDLSYPTFQIIKKLVEREIKEKDGFYERQDIDLKTIKSYDEFCQILSDLRVFKDVTSKEYIHISKWVELALEWLEIVL